MNNAQEQEKNAAAADLPERPRRKTVWKICRILILLIPLFLLFLPRILEGISNRILKNYIEKGGMDVELRELGLGRSMIGVSVRFPEDGTFTPGKRMLLGNLGVTYAPHRLIAGTLDSVSLCNVNLPLTLKDGKVDIPLKPLFKIAGSAAKQAEKPLEAPFFDLPLRIREIDLSGNLILLHGKDFLLVPFMASVTQSEQSGWANVNYSMQIFLSAGNQVKLSGAADLHRGTVSGTADIKLQPGTLPQMLRNLIPSPSPAGRIELAGDFTWNLRKMHPEKLESRLKIQDINCSYGAYTIKGSAGTRISYQDGIADIRYSGGLHTTIGGITYALKQFSVRSELKGGKGVSGTCSVNVGGEKNGDFSGQFVLKRNQEKALEFTLRPLPRRIKTQEILFNGIRLVFPVLQETGNYVRLTFQNDIQVSGMIQVPEAKISKDTFSLTAKQFRLDLGGTPAALRIGMTLPELAFSGGDTALAALKGISAKVNLDGKGKSVFSVKKILCGEHEVGQIEGTLRPDPAKGHHELRADIDTLGVRSHLHVSFLQENMLLDGTFSIPEQKLAKPLDLGKYAPALNSFQLESASLKADCSYRWTPLGQRGSVSVDLSGINVESAEKKLKLTDAALHFSLPNLPELESAAGQRFRFKAFQFDNLKFDSGRVNFRMETPKTWYLEGATFNWCSGKIRIGSVKIAPETERFSIVMYCDRVRLGQLLAQFGIGADAGDNAALNGTIPVSIRNGRIIFRNGFLYSTPGETGILKLVPNATVNAMGQSSVEMSFALSALKDFQYQWVKLTMNTVNDDLKLKFQVDGRPSGPLPFSIDPDSGRPVKTQGTNRFQGIPLDVNVTIPLTKSLELYRMYNKLMNGNK